MLAPAFGQFASTLRYGDLPRQAVDDLKLRLLDLIGAAVSGVEAGSYAAFQQPTAPGRARIWASGACASARDAAFLNGFVSHATYMEDGSRFSGGHPASVVVPAALAELEEQGGDGKALLTAMAAGYEVFLRLGRSVYPEVVRRGFQSTAALGAVAAAAATASARNLAPGGAANAIAIAANLGFGLKHALRASGSQPVQVGRASEAGVVAAHAAARGAEGAPDILERGLLPLLGGPADYAVAAIGLGATFCIGETYIKLHGGCRGNHAPIDLVSDLVARSGRPVEGIERIELAVDSVTHAADIEAPATAEQAQFSAGFAVAAKLLTGDALPGRYSAERLSDPAQRSLMARIHVGVDPALDADYPDRRGATARLTFSDGASVAGWIDNARGEPEVPASHAEVEAKFICLTRGRLGNRAERLRDLVMAIDDVDDLSTVSALLAADTGTFGSAAMRWKEG